MGSEILENLGCMYEVQGEGTIDEKYVWCTYTVWHLSLHAHSSVILCS